VRIAIASIITVATLGAACASGGTHVVTSESAGEVSRSSPVTVRVKSEYVGPLVVYAVTEGVSMRLGDVQGSRIETFRLPFTTIPTNGISIIAVPVGGGGRARSGTLLVQPGATIDFTVGAALTNSAATVRSP
jgi:hypothetical protein